MVKMNPTAYPWEPAQPSSNGNPEQSQNSQNQDSHHAELAQLDDEANQTFQPFHGRIPSRDQILANGRILEPGRLLQVLTSMHPTTGECFAFLAMISQAQGTTQQIVTVLYWGRGISVDRAIVGLDAQVNMALHAKLRGLVRVSPAFRADAWNGM